MPGVGQEFVDEFERPVSTVMAAGRILPLSLAVSMQKTFNAKAQRSESAKVLDVRVQDLGPNRLVAIIGGVEGGLACFASLLLCSFAPLRLCVEFRLHCYGLAG